jgi:hypothetical protein
MSETDPQAEPPRVGGQGEEESNKDYCERMVRQHCKLAPAVFERLFGEPADTDEGLVDYCKRVADMTEGLAHDDPSTFALFAKTWRECLSEMEAQPC